MEPTRLFDFLYYQQENFPLDQSFGGRRDDGEWHFYSTAEMIRLANQVSCGLLRLGVQPGDRIGIVVYKNRPEWTIIDQGIQQIGAIDVPVYPTISPAEYEYIFNDAGVKMVFAGAGDLYDKVSKAAENVPSLEKIYTLDRQEGRLYWEDMLADDGMGVVRAKMDKIRPDDLATIIYTSGTTGKPKGVMLSHHNIASNVKGVQPIFPTSVGEIALSFLPLCHIFERTASYSYMYTGTSVAYTGTENLGGEDGDLQAIRPHFFTTVPRLLEKVYEKIYSKGLELSGIKKNLFFWALGLTKDYDYDKRFSGLDALQRRIADKLIFSKWREALGGRVKGIVTGAAPCPVNILRTFSAAGIPVREAYGLTETSPGLTANTFEPGGAVMGSVGSVIDQVSLRIDTEAGDFRPGEGEVLATGPNIMLGYHNNTEATDAVIFEEDGRRWFRTGDVGKLVPGPGGREFLRITDRKKELLKTSGGKYVAPAPIESRFKENFLIEQIMVVGDKRKYVSAIIVPAEDNLKQWCEKNDIPFGSLEEAVKQPQVIERYQRVVDELNPNFSHIEQIKKFCLVSGQWEPVKADGSDAELTPTLKLKRRVINDKYARLIEALYAEA